LSTLAHTDPLTGLLNRRGFDAAAETAFAQGDRVKSETAIVIIDIDQFKCVNDRYGHDPGDQALVNLAQVLRANTRCADIAARRGSEEFAILLPQTDLNEAMRICEHARKAVEMIKMKSGDNKFGFTIGAGIAVSQDDDRNWPQTMARADQALYRAKSTGRNRVAILTECPNSTEHRNRKSSPPPRYPAT
jgi:diguanylate cyclase (GGDEF)-like protein